jgi:isoquinoline 1-oxidoreductase subunit beta
MTSIQRISRRRFLELTGIASGALVLMGSFPVDSLAAVMDEAGGKALNIFVSVTSDGTVEIIAHRSEMGTGIRTSLPQVVADEMEADWSRVHVIQGLANAAYGGQNTDGSKSMRNFYHIMRQMGAAARHSLEQAAAIQWDTNLSMVGARNHKVYHEDGRELDFGSLVELASRQPLPPLDSLKLKDSSEFRYIGKSVPVVDLRDLCTGGATYGVDVRIPGMVFASIERTPFLQGSVKSYDRAAALAQPGVVDVIHIEGTPLPSRFNALEGVAVIARDSFSALAARARLSVSWQGSAHQSFQSNEFLTQLESRVASGPGRIARSRGDAMAALDSATRTVEASYRAPFLAHASMEPPVATAHIHSGICEIWTSTQVPQGTQRAVAQALRVEVDTVKVHVTLLGGGFGRKAQPDFAVEAALLARILERPVQVAWTREDDIHNDYFHACSAQYFKAGLNESGAITAWLAREATPPISSISTAGANTRSDGDLSQTFASVPFAVPNLQIESHEADAHTRIGWLRSVFNLPYAFGVGTFVDELAHAVGRKPVDFWLDLIGEDRKLDFSPEGFNFSNHGKSLQEYPYDTGRFKNTIRSLAGTIPLDEGLPDGQGWGLAAMRSFLSYVAVASKVEIINGRLRVMEMHCAIDAGTVVNPDRVHAQLEGAMIFGLSAALMGEITFADGAAEQSNFHDYPIARINQVPDVMRTHIIPSKALPTGVGEPGVPPVAPSIGNAIFAASSRRIREFPFNKHFRI